MHGWRPPLSPLLFIMYQLDKNWVTIELFSSYLGIGHGKKSKDKSAIMAKTRKISRPQKSSAKAKTAVNKMKGAVIKTTPPSEESDNMKANRKTVVGKYSKVEPHNRSRSAKSKADKKIGEDDIDQTGIKSITKAASSVSASSGPAKRNSAAAGMAHHSS
jgi:hypothetical protein